MLTKKEIKKIQKALPLSVSHGYDLIQQKIPALSKDQISKAFNCEKRYRPDVMEAAVQVIQEYKDKVKELKNKIHTL